MSTPLQNGAVLPHGLLNDNGQGMMEGFNKSYKNFPLRVGVITASYPVTDPNNKTKLTTEYDVVVIEQNADVGATTIKYPNCMSSEALGSIADYLEAALRPMKKKTTKGDSINLNGQNGAIVLLLCLDGMADKGIIIGSLTHPDRKTNLKDVGPLLVGQYNGVKITVNTDGSTSLVFQGAMDNDGKVIDSSQGNTTIKIEKDGSFQADHDKITFRMDRSGVATLKAKSDINLNTEANLNITATKNVNVKCVDANVDASGKGTVKIGADASVDVGGKADVKVGGATNITSGGTAKIKAPQIELNGAISGITTENSHAGVIDFITGVPVQPSQTVKSDI